MNIFSTKGLIGKFSEQGLDEDVQPNRSQLTKQDIVSAANVGSERWRRMFMNLISCFEQEGEFALYSTIAAHSQTKGPANAEITAAVEAGDEQALETAFCKALSVSFMTLYDKGKLERIQLVDELPAEAKADLKKMRLFFAPAVSGSIAAVADHLGVPLEPVLTPTEICANDYKTMGSAAFQAKYLHADGPNRQVYERAIQEGRI